MDRTQVPSGPTSRMARFQAALQERGARAALICAPRHIHYLTGHVPAGRSPAFVLARIGEQPLLVLGDSEAEAARAATADIAVAPYEDYSIHRVVLRRREAAQALAQAVARYHLGKDGPVAIEADDLPAFAAPHVAGADVVDIAPTLRALRACKDPDEQDKIRRAVAVTNAGHAAAREAAAPGAAEMQVYAAIQRACVLEAGEPIAFDGDFLSGERTVLMGGAPTDRVLREGDLFICDLFPTVADYWADTTRTFAVGAASAAQRELYEVVRGALERGRRAVRPGALASEVYHEMRAAIAEAGHADRFPHHGGHGIGLEPHESPWIIPGDDTALRPGMTMTLEPGVYLEGVGGVRLEDNYIITRDGADVIPPYPLGLDGQPPGAGATSPSEADKW